MREIGDVGGGEGGDSDTFECVDVEAVDDETMGVGGEWDDTGCCPIMIGEEYDPIIVQRGEHK